jgi:hypothetical protein
LFPAAWAAEKPKVRAITAFVRLERSRYLAQVQQALRLLRTAKAEYEHAGYEIQTLRITTQPLPDYTRGPRAEEALAFFRAYDDLAGMKNFLRQSAPPCSMILMIPARQICWARSLGPQRTWTGV